MVRAVRGCMCDAAGGCYRVELYGPFYQLGRRQLPRHLGRLPYLRDMIGGEGGGEREGRG